MPGTLGMASLRAQWGHIPQDTPGIHVSLEEGEQPGEGLIFGGDLDKEISR